MKREMKREMKRDAADVVDDLVYGIHAVKSVLTDQPSRVRAMWVQAGLRNARLTELIGLAEAAGIRVQFHPREQLDSRAQGVHQGVVLQCSAVALADETELELRWPQLSSGGATGGATDGGTRAPLLLILDGVQDPRNLGACLRSAEAAGVDAVLLPKRRTAPVSALVRKTASGAAEHLFIVEVSNLARRLEWLKAQGVWLVGAAGGAEKPYTAVDFADPVAIVLGGEERGLRDLTRRHCDHLVSIPMQGNVSSLNVSVATGILLFEALRQRS